MVAARTRGEFLILCYTSDADFCILESERGVDARLTIGLSPNLIITLQQAGVTVYA